MIKKISLIGIIALILSSCGTSSKTTSSKMSEPTKPVAKTSENKKFDSPELSNKIKNVQKVNYSKKSVSVVDSKNASRVSKTQTLKKVK